MQERDIQRYEVFGARSYVLEYLDVHTFFIFDACGIKRHGIAALASHKKIGLFRGKRGEQFLYQLDQLAGDLADFQPEALVHLRGSVFQYHRVRNAEQGHHPLVAQQHFRPGKTECVPVCNRSREGVLGVFQRVPPVLQQEGEEDVFLALVVVVQIQAGEADLPADFGERDFVIAHFRVKRSRSVYDLLPPDLFLLFSPRPDKS